MTKIWVDDDHHVFMDMGDGIEFQLVWVTKEQMNYNSFLTTTWNYLMTGIYDSLHRTKIGDDE